MRLISDNVNNFKDYLEAYLNIFWLRPESAVWRAYDAVVMSDLDWSKRPSLDLCCADGVNSFLLRGGLFDITFDAFLSIRDMSVREFFSGEKDIYDYPFNERQEIGITRRPKEGFDYGIDWKYNSLKKAARIGLYKHLICQDANDSLPLNDKSIGLVFSNSIYWLKDARFAMCELNRILKDDGRVITIMPDVSIKKHYIYEKYMKYGWEFCKVLNMGRYGHIMNCHDFAGWESIFADSGFKIESSASYLSGRFVEISEISLRPLSKVLIKMANTLSVADRAEIKKEWIETLMHVIMPMFEDGYLSDTGGEQTFFMFELAKK